MVTKKGGLVSLRSRNDLGVECACAYEVKEFVQSVFVFLKPFWAFSFLIKCWYIQ